MSSTNKLLLEERQFFKIIDIMKNNKVATTDSSELLKFDRVQNNFKEFFVEDNIRKKQWFLYCSYNPNRNNNVSHMKKVSGGLTNLNGTYNNTIPVVACDVESEADNMSEFLNINLKNLMEQKTY